MEYTIDLNRVATGKDHIRSTRLLATDILANGYASLKEFFNDMPDQDLEAYLDIVDKFEDPNSPLGEELVLLVGLLVMAEGLDSGLSDDDAELEIMSKRCNQLFFLLSMESLARKGLIKFYRENISFGEDMMDKIIAEKL
jgi:hypothetical protein